MPLAVGAAAVAVGFGGGVQLGALTQAVTGPVIPDSRTTAQDDADRGRPDTALLAQAGVSARLQGATSGGAAAAQRALEQRSQAAQPTGSAPLSSEAAQGNGPPGSTGAPAQAGTQTSTSAPQAEAGVTPNAQPPSVPPPPGPRAVAPPGARSDAPPANGPQADPSVPQVVGQLVTALGGLLTPR